MQPTSALAQSTQQLAAARHVHLEGQGVVDGEQTQQNCVEFRIGAAALRHRAHVPGGHQRLFCVIKSARSK